MAMNDLSPEQLGALINGYEEDLDEDAREFRAFQQELLDEFDGTPSPSPQRPPRSIPNSGAHRPKTSVNSRGLGHIIPQMDGTQSESDDTSSRNLFASYNSPRTGPETTSSPLPARSRPVNRKRPRENIENELSGSGNNLVSSNRTAGPSRSNQLHELLGLSDSDDLADLEEEQREAEEWLAQRKAQERADEELARSLAASWSEPAVSSSPPRPIPGDVGADFALMPPPTRPASREHVRLHAPHSYTPAVAFSSTRRMSSVQMVSRSAPSTASANYIEISSDSDIEDLSTPAPKRQRTTADRTVSSRYGFTPRTSSWNPYPGSSNLNPGSHSKVDLSGPYNPFSLNPLPDAARSQISANPSIKAEPDSWSWSAHARTSTLDTNSPILRTENLVDPFVKREYGHSAWAGSSGGATAFNGGLPDYSDLFSNPKMPGSYPSQVTPETNAMFNRIQQPYGLPSNFVSPDEAKEELKNLLQNIRPDEELSIDRQNTPPALKFTLMGHQQLGLAWMQSMEEGTNRGGILADDMGLGKTIQALSLMVTRPSTNPDRKTTLIVAPVALMHQWKREIEQKLHSTHQLTIYIFHGEQKVSLFSHLKRYDVVLTTYGTLASELKRKEYWDRMRKENPGTYQNLSAEMLRLPMLGEDSKFYRVILDEAQCIKNRSTRAAVACCSIQAKYRWCMSGTPMMNNVGELHSLIKFLRIGPYNNLEKFNATFARPLKDPSSDSDTYKRAMQQLQALLKAILLRRTKTSKINGEPILSLPPRTVEVVHAVFNEDEQELYNALEAKTQVQFNRYMEAGTVGRNYSNILVLLLRLRQCCCHPHLMKDFAVKVAATEQGIDYLANAQLLDSAVIRRLKENEAAECPICMDAVENSIIFYPCGHGTCNECYARISDPSAALARGIENNVEVKCPNCRAKVDTKKITDMLSFRKAHLGVSDDPEPEPEPEKADESDSDDSDSDHMSDFVVDDDEDRYAGRGRKKSNGKGKARDKTRKTLAELKKESTRNIKAKKKYLRRLQKTWIPSAKTEKAMEVLSQIQATGKGEKTIVFSQFTSLLDVLEVPIAEEGWGYRRYDGSMKPGDRNQAVVDFTDKPECQIMLVSLKAGNSGLNLVAASQVIIFDPFWNPYIEEQAIDRAHRLGQIRPVVVHRILVPNTVEDRIIQLQEKKRKVIEGALDEKASHQISRLGTRELAFLFGVSRQ